MNSRIARQRLSAVLKTDSVTASDGDFLATHVAIRKLYLMTKFTHQPTSGKTYSEEAVYRDYVLNPQNKHQFITVCGQSGTGKSHLIRWFEARFEQEMHQDEVVLFIRRSDNTLKGTIRQLLEKPEVQGISNREVYERLVKASINMDADKLKGMIYHNFINEIEFDDDSHEITLTSINRKRLVAFLSNEVIRDRMLDVDGPIERMYSKIEEHTLVDRDTVAQFLPQDFYVNADLFEQIQLAGADRKAEKLARELMSDTDGTDDAKKFAAFLNQFVNNVIQQCAGIEPGDFRQIFQDIRKELFRIGKNLTLFIEDVTSFTGVDDALLDALIVEHTGMNAAEGICRISSIVGTTDNYLQNHFRDNHKDRITQYVYIPSDVFDEAGLFEFVGRYLNAMSLPNSAIDEWLGSHADPMLYPVHDTLEGAMWEHVSVDNDKKLCLYPFTKHSILYMYDYCMTKGQKTPRYIIRDIIEPVVLDALNNISNFPGMKINLINVNTSLSYRIQNQVHDEALTDRYLRFLSVWGNGKPEQYTDQNVTYISSVRKEIIEELGFPVLSFTETEPLVPQKDTVPEAASAPASEAGEIPRELQERVAAANKMLTDWSLGKSIDASATVGTVGIVNKALTDMNDYLRCATHWQAEGFSMDNMAKMKKLRLVGFENQTKGDPGLLTIPANWESLNVVNAFIRWHEYGDKSWNYKDAYFDAYLITSWTAKVRDQIIQLVRDISAPTTPYIEAAVTSEIYRQIICGLYRERSLKNYTTELLFSPRQAKAGKSSHCAEWNAFTAYLAQRGADSINKETIRQYFNISQGSGTTVLVLNEPLLTRTLTKIKCNKLTLDPDDIGIRDEVKQRRDVYEYARGILERIGRVAHAELESAKPYLATIASHFDDGEIDEDDIERLVDAIKQFYKEINNSQINIANVSADAIKRNAKQIVKAINDISEVIESEDPLAILMTFSGDPISDIKPLAELLTQLDKDVEKAEKMISDRLDTLTEYAQNDAATGKYANVLEMIDTNQAMLQGGVEPNDL